MSRPAPISCPNCRGAMDPRSKRGCSDCLVTGRPRTPSSEILYARELGISPRRLLKLGGEQKLRALDPDARAVLINPHRYKTSQTISVGGLKARGMRSRVPGIKRFLIPPHVEMGMPLEMGITENMLEVVGLDGWD